MYFPEVLNTFEAQREDALYEPVGKYSVSATQDIPPILNLVSHFPSKEKVCAEILSVTANADSSKQKLNSFRLVFFTVVYPSNDGF